MKTLHIDVETRSAVDLKKTGVYVYAADPTTDLWCVSYAYGDEDVKTWLPGDPIPDEILDQVASGGTFTAHNAQFERIIWKRILAPRYGWPEPPTTSWRCTMVMAYAMAMPGSLDQAAPAAGLDVRKDAAGHRLMLQMARPRSRAPIVWWNDPDKLKRLVAYCEQDVVVERELEKRLRPLKASELDLWHLDQRINDRGVNVDVQLCEAAKAIVAKVEKSFDEEIQELTTFEVTACSNRNEIIRYLRRRGVETESIAKDQVEDLLARKDLTPDVRRVLELRKGAAKASVAKVDALMQGMDADGRARGLLQFHAAGTGRWSGRRFQPQNLKRPDLDTEGINRAIKLLRTGDYETFRLVYDDPLSVIGDCIRGMITAKPGHRIVAADFANIEGRVLAWLAGEQWKLDAFRAYDVGEGPDLYLVTASGILGKPVDQITKAERQAYGKTPELACGFQGAVGAFQTMAVNLGVNISDEQVRDIVKAYREKNARIRQFWYDTEEAAVNAIEHPGQRFAVGRIAFKKVGSFLFMRLPSGRFLTYPFPRMEEKDMPWVDDEGRPVRKWCMAYNGTNSYTRKFERCFAYGGLLVENATQAAARDILAGSMPRLEAAGYSIILTVHDEAVAEAPIGHGSLDEMIAIMGRGEAWSAGLPIAVAGFEGERYGK